MKILILNWRDIRNPQSGGAELLTHEMAKRWIVLGHSVTQLSSAYGDAHDEVIDGVHIIRRGCRNIFSGKLPVHLEAFFWYMRYGRRKFDVVIDEIHGIPFFTPFYVKEKKVALLCEVADDIWDIVFKFPLNIIGKMIENIYFSFYKDIPFLTISHSTKQDIITKGVQKDHITILPMGISLPKKLPKSTKEKHDTIIFVGRLTKAKGVEDAVYMFSELTKDIPKIRLWIVGSGELEYEKKLRDLVAFLGLTDNIKFYGFVSLEKKFELMARAHVLVNPSVREGWGLTVPEAGTVGTPAVAYRVSGLRDLVHERKNGLLVNPDPESLARGVKTILSDKALYKILQNGARIEAKQYDWDKTAEAGLKILMK